MFEATGPHALDVLPVGSIVVDIREADSPVIACKAARGDWAVMGDDPDRRWWPTEMFSGAEGGPLRVIYVPATERTQATFAQDADLQSDGPTTAAPDFTDDQIDAFEQHLLDASYARLSAVLAGVPQATIIEQRRESTRDALRALIAEGTS